MKEKTFKVTYKNGTVREYRAYSMELEGGKLYQCKKAFVGDQGVPSVLDGSNIASVEELINRAEQIRELTGMNRRKFCEAYNIPYATMCDWEAGRVKPADYVMDLLEKVVRSDIAEKLSK